MPPDVLNPASVSALLSTGASLIGGIGAWVLGRAPDWDDVRPLAWVGFSAAAVAACSFPATLDAPLALHAWAGRAQVLAVPLAGADPPRPGAAGGVVFTAAPGAAPAVREFLARQPQPVLERPFGLEDVQGALRRVGAVPAEAAPPGGADLPEHALGRVRRK